MTDGTGKFVEQGKTSWCLPYTISQSSVEYGKSSGMLGIVGKSEFSLATYMPRPWYWDFFNSLFLNLPLVSSVYFLYKIELIAML